MEDECISIHLATNLGISTTLRAKPMEYQGTMILFINILGIFKATKPVLRNWWCFDVPQEGSASREKKSYEKQPVRKLLDFLEYELFQVVIIWLILDLGITQCRVRERQRVNRITVNQETSWPITHHINQFPRESEPWNLREIPFQFRGHWPDLVVQLGPKFFLPNCLLAKFMCASL
jgi:hypothetical protein